MKKILLISLLVINAQFIFSQSFQMPKKYSGKRHRGTFISLSLGANSTNIKADSKNYGQSVFTGSGVAFDFKIGGAVVEDLIVHATLFVHDVTGPNIDVDDYMGTFSYKTNNKLSITEGLIGAGLTYYTPYNFLFSSSIGFGSFSYVDEENDLDFSTDNGFSFQLKAGKEWWVSKKWGIGLALYYHRTNCLNQEGNDAEEKLTSNNVGVVFNATFNGRK